MMIGRTVSARAAVAGRLLRQDVFFFCRVLLPRRFLFDARNEKSPPVALRVEDKNAKATHAPVWRSGRPIKADVDTDGVRYELKALNRLTIMPLSHECNDAPAPASTSNPVSCT
jgi:hypothetical protein